jgi:hypothetical protein
MEAREGAISDRKWQGYCSIIKLSKSDQLATKTFVTSVVFDR